MWKQNKARIIATTLALLLPSAIGLILWQRLPELMPIHFNFNGVADNWAGRPFAVFAMPGFFLICYLICIFAMLHDPKGDNIGGRLISILMWVMPVTSLIVSICIYAYALNMPINISFICISLIGVVNILLGNVMPKIRHNYTVGIKTAWTLADPENWYHTHRVAGWSSVTAGVLILATALCMSVWLMLALTTAAIAVPVIYSFVYYKRHKSGGEDGN